jgi:hypothetical protein
VQVREVRTLSMARAPVPPVEWPFLRRKGPWQRRSSPRAGETSSGLTSEVCGSRLRRNWGGVAVKRHRRILVLFLATGVFCGSAIPPVDLPETSYNESDAPINLAPPAQATINSVRPVSDPLLMPGLRLYCAGCVVRSLVVVPRQRPRHSLQDLLCTFLI